MAKLRKHLTALTLSFCVGVGSHAAAEPKHPLDALTSEEIRKTVRILRDAGHADRATLFPSITLEEMEKAAVRAWRRGDPVLRAARAVVRRDRKVFEAVVDLTAERVSSFRHIAGVQPNLMEVEREAVWKIVTADKRWRAAMRRRGYTSFGNVFCWVLSAGYFRTEAYGGRRVFRVPCKVRGGKYSYVAGRPIGGLHAVVDIDEGKVIDVIDTGPIPVPEIDAEREKRPPQLRPPMNPVVNMSPLGVNFRFSGTIEVEWQNWSFHLRIDRRTGPVISLVKYRHGDRLRDIAYQMALAEIFVPYMDADRNWGYRTILDAGEFGLGYNASTLKEGTDCPPQAAYISLIVADEMGAPRRIKRAICMFERATGDPLWRHGDAKTNDANSRPAIELVVRTIPMLGNYDYVIDWAFTQHAEIHVRVGATGIDMAKGVRARSMADATARDDTAHGSLVAPGLVAPLHDHFFGFRLDLDVDGVANTLIRDEVTMVRLGQENPRRSIWTLRSKPVLREGPVMPMPHGGALRIVNTQARPNKLGHVPAYQLVPGNGALSILADDDDPQARAAFSAERVWLTAYKANELYPAGDYPNQSTGGDGLPIYSRDGDAVENTDLVFWVTLGFNHLTRAEDWPIMPTRWHGFIIRPYNFFDESPAFDVPPRFRERPTASGEQ